MSRKRHIPVLHRNLQRALRQGSLDEAEQLLRQLKSEDPLSIETRGLELELLVLRNAKEEARALGATLVDAFPASARVLFWAGRAAFARRDYKEAISHFEESRRLAPRQESTRWLAKALTNAGQFEEAEPLLLELATLNTRALPDLAWLYERREEVDRAIATLERYLERRPDDTFAKKQLTKLIARKTAPSELIDEVDTLTELGETIPEHLLTEYVRKLFESGRSSEARRLIRQRAPALTPRATLDLAWIAHKRDAFDISYELFTACLDQNLSNVMFLKALERAARESNRVDDLIEVYQQRCEVEPKLYGHMTKLKSSGR
jgi:tetratricopeptide (TPR) repeat protein